METGSLGLAYPKQDNKQLNIIFEMFRLRLIDKKQFHLYIDPQGNSTLKLGGDYDKLAFLGEEMQFLPTIDDTWALKVSNVYFGDPNGNDARVNLDDIKLEEQKMIFSP